MNACCSTPISQTSFWHFNRSSHLGIHKLLVGDSLAWQKIRFADTLESGINSRISAVLSGKICPREVPRVIKLSFEAQPRRTVWLPEGPPVAKFFQKTPKFFQLFFQTFGLKYWRWCGHSCPRINSEHILVLPRGKSESVIRKCAESGNYQAFVVVHCCQFQLIHPQILTNKLDRVTSNTSFWSDS